MSDSYRALCSDFYVNQKIQLKMDLPKDRATNLEMLERTRKQFPAMTNFRRFKDELALESPQSEMPHRWLSIRGNSIRSGTVNAPELPDYYQLHKAILEYAPLYLSISPIDIESIELLFGFDLPAGGSHDQIVFDALYTGSPLALLADVEGSRPIECQPIVAIAIPNSGGQDIEAFFEVKTRSRDNNADCDADSSEPISVYLTLRRFGAVVDLMELPGIFRQLSRLGEDLIDSRVIPRLVVPLRNAITPFNH